MAPQVGVEQDITPWHSPNRVLYIVARGKVHNDHRYEIRSGNKSAHSTTKLPKRTQHQVVVLVIYLLMDVPQNTYTIMPPIITPINPPERTMSQK